MLPMVPNEVNDSLEPALDKRVLRANGDNDTFANGTNIPKLGGQTKYLRKDTRYQLGHTDINRADGIKNIRIG